MQKSPNYIIKRVNRGDAFELNEVKVLGIAATFRN